MSRPAFRGLLLAVVAAAVCTLPVSAQPAAQSVATPLVVPGEIIVLSAYSASTTDPANVAGPGGTAPAPHIPLTASRVRVLAGASGLSVVSIEPLNLPQGAWVLRFTGDMPPALAAAALMADPAVSYAGPNHIIPVPVVTDARHASSVLPSAGAPNDPWFPSQRELETIGVPVAWEKTRGAGMVIAIIDTGIELDNPELVDRLVVHQAEAQGEPGVDDDGNGYVDDIHGFDFTDAPGLPGSGDYLDRDGDPEDDFGHGTQVAGVAAATGNNGIGIVGVAPEASILAIRAGLRTTLPLLPAVLQEDDAAAGIIYAADNGADIINLSFGDVVDAPVIREAIRYATDRGVLVIASAGNQFDDEAFYPSSYPRVVSVGASDAARKRASFSTSGPDLDFLAPGVSVLAAGLETVVERVSGTSFSSPIAAGVAALVWSVNPGWSAEQVIGQLKLTADREDASWTPDVGWGILDAAAAVGAGDPPVVEITRVSPGPFGLGGVFPWGTVAGASLESWDLSLLSASAGALSKPEAVLVEFDAGQRVDESLPVGDPVIIGAGSWLVRLRARFAGWPEIVDYNRLTVSPSEPPIALDVEPQVAGASGWDVRVSWETESLQQGAALLLSPGGRMPWGETVTAGNRHVIRLAGPHPAGTWMLNLLSRGELGGPYQLLDQVSVTVPVAHTFREPQSRTPPAYGTPLHRVVDFDRDLRPEIVIERPPLTGFYGSLGWFEIDDSGELVELDEPNEGLTGIPRDVADADGDGLDEMIVFRLADWEVMEQHAPGDFPNRRRLAAGPDDGVPLGFAETPDGTWLLSVVNDRVRVYDPKQSYALLSVAEASSGASFLRQGGAWGDFDGDGDHELVLADDASRIQVFSLGPTGISWEADYAAPGPLLGRMLKVASPTPGRLDFLTLEFDPQFPEEEGDLTRTATRVRRWRWTEDGPIPVASLAFSGIESSGNRFLSAGEDAFLFRAGRIDRITLDQGDLAWGGRLFDGTGYEGAVLAPLPGTSDRLLWIGSSSDEGAVLSRVTLGPGTKMASPGIRVTGAEIQGDSLALTLQWSDVGCSGSLQLTRFDDGEAIVPIAGNVAVDTIPLGETVGYRLFYGDCAPSELLVTAQEPATITASWSGERRLILDLSRPVKNGSKPGRFTFYGTTDRPGESEGEASTVEVLRGGTQIMLAAPSITDYFGLVIDGLWDESGLPIGGSVPLDLRLPSQEPGLTPLVVREVSYRENPPEIHVTLNRGLGSGCSFILEPGGVDLMPTDAGAADLVLPLGRPLDPGTYTLSPSGGCPQAFSGLAAAREFRVGFRFYPNPVRGGEDLTLENLAPGTVVEVLDAAGHPLVRRVLQTTLATVELDLAPGLYFVRTMEPNAPVRVEKLAIIR